MKQVPLSSYQETCGMIYFARMLDKIRKHAKGELREDFIENLGIGFDERCVKFLRVGYEDLVGRTLEGGSDEEILQWCYDTGRRLDENDIQIWNGFLCNRGIHDVATEVLIRRKKESGLADRDDIQTMLDYLEVDEGRKP
jgi:hypothetical protein